MGGDQVVLQVAANLFQRQIVILPVFWSAAHLPSLGITLISPSSRSPSKTSSSSSALFLQYFSESRFLTPHYQSVRPKAGDNHLVESLQRSLEGEGTARKDEEEEEFITQLNDLPDPPCTPMRNLRSSFFTPSPYNSFILPHSSSPLPSNVSPSPSSSFSMSSASFSMSTTSSSMSTTSSPPSSPSLSNTSSSEFMHLLEREVRGLGRQTRI